VRYPVGLDVEHMQLERLVLAGFPIEHVQRGRRLSVGRRPGEAHIAWPFGRAVHPGERDDGFGPLVPAVERRHFPYRLFGEEFHQFVDVVCLERRDVAIQQIFGLGRIRLGQFLVLTGTDGLDLSQDARALVAHLTEAGRLMHTFEPGRGGYVYVIDGRVDLDGEQLGTGDAIKVTGAADLAMTTDVAAELILIDVPLEFEPIGVWAGEW